MTDIRKPGGNQLFDLGWLIGAIDGEGSYVLSKQYHHKSKTLYFFPSIEITNDNEIFITNCDRIIKEIFNVGAYISTKKQRNNGKIGYKISLRGMKRLYKALPIIVANEVSKFEQANLLLEYVTNRMNVNIGTPVTDRDIEIAMKIRMLNNSKNVITKDIPRRLN